MTIKTLKHNSGR